jgi:hypothetical protein
MVRAHLDELYGTLLEQNLARVVAPFSRVEIAHVAELMALPVKEVERKYVRVRLCVCVCVCVYLCVVVCVGW